MLEIYKNKDGVEYNDRVSVRAIEVPGVLESGEPLNDATYSEIAAFVRRVAPAYPSKAHIAGFERFVDPDTGTGMIWVMLRYDDDVVQSPVANYVFGRSHI